MRTKVFVGEGYYKDYIGFIEDGRIYINNGNILEELVARYRDGNIYYEKSMFDSNIAQYDDKYLYFQRKYNKEPMAYLEDGKIFEEKYPHKCIGFYEGYDNPACIALLLCDLTENKSNESIPKQRHDSIGHGSANGKELFSVKYSHLFFIGLVVIWIAHNMITGTSPPLSFFVIGFIIMCIVGCF